MSEKNRILEVEVLLPQSVLDKNPEINKVYDADKKQLKFEISKNIPKSFSDKLEALMPEFKGTDIVQFNPLINAINELQNIKMLIPDADDFDASERVLIDNNKIIRSFNGSLTKAKKEIKQPHVDFNKSVDELFDVFKTESDNAKNALEKNFSAIVAERERIKKEKEDKKKAEELERINKLTESNTELADKLKNQSIITAKNEIENNLNKLISNVSAKIPDLNIEGLNTLLNAIKSTTKTQYVSISHEELLGLDVIQEYYKIYEQNKAIAIRQIESAINSIRMAEELAKKNLQTPAPPEPNLSNIETNAEFVNPQNETPFVPTPVVKEPTNDLERFQFITDFNQKILDDYTAGMEKIKSLKFDHPDLVKLQSVLSNEQYPKVQEFLSKLATFTNNKNEFIINNLK